MKRRATLAGLCLSPWVLAGCASSVNETRWYELRADPPGPALALQPGDGAVWEVARVVPLPGALERDTLVVASGNATLVPLVGHRWVEPLRESIPGRLAADLARLRGPGLVWRAPAPGGVTVDRRLQVEIVSMVADAGRRSLRLRARWWLSDERAAAAVAPALGQADFEVALADSSIDALATGHRAAVWQLAQRIVAGA